MTRREKLIEIIKRLPKGLVIEGDLLSDTAIGIRFPGGYLKIYALNDAEGIDEMVDLYWDKNEIKEMVQDYLEAAAAARELVEIDV